MATSAKSPAETLLDAVRASRVAGPERLRTLAAAAADGSEEDLAQRLVADGILNRWQAEYLLAGAASLRIGNCLLTGRVGQDALGEQFEALQDSLQRRVRLQVVPAELVSDAGKRERLIDVARNLIRIDHPAILHLYDIAADGEKYFLVTEAPPAGLAGGLNSPELGDAEQLRAIRDLIDAVRHVHQCGMVHGAIAPECVLVSTAGELKLDRLAWSVLQRELVSGSLLDTKDAGRQRTDWSAVAGMASRAIATTPGEASQISGEARKKLVNGIRAAAADADPETGFVGIVELLNRQIGELESAANNDGPAVREVDAKPAGGGRAPAAQPTRPVTQKGPSPASAQGEKRPAPARSSGKAAPSSASSAGRRWYLQPQWLSVAALIAVSGMIAAWKWGPWSGSQSGTGSQRSPLAASKSGGTGSESGASGSASRGSTRSRGGRQASAESPRKTEKPPVGDSGDSGPEVDLSSTAAGNPTEQSAGETRDGGTSAISHPNGLQGSGSAGDSVISVPVSNDPFDVGVAAGSVAVPPPASGAGAAGDPVSAATEVASSPAVRQDPEKPDPFAVPGMVGGAAPVPSPGPGAAAPELAAWPAAIPLADAASHERQELCRLTAGTLPERVELSLEYEPETVGKGRNWFAFRRRGDDWELNWSRKGPAEELEPVARLKLAEDGTLSFQWLEGVDNRHAANCVVNSTLVVRIGDVFQRAALRQTIEFEAPALNADSLSGSVRLEIPWLPRAESVTVELGELHKESGWPAGLMVENETFANRQPAQIFLKGAAEERLLWMAVAGRIRGSRLEVDLGVQSGVSGRVAPLRAVDLQQMVETFQSVQAMWNQRTAEARLIAENAQTGFKTKTRDALKQVEKELEAAQARTKLAFEHEEWIRGAAGRPVPVRVMYHAGERSIELARSSGWTILVPAQPANAPAAERKQGGR